MEVENAISSAKDWLEAARVTAEAKVYSQALYSMEMAVEIAFKAVLIAMHVEVPKVHDVRRAVRIYLRGNKLISQSFLADLENYLATYETLLRIRPIVGYGFEKGISKDEMRNQVSSLFPLCSRIIDECEKAIESIERRE
ncbi:MAG: HEPN domain-containing protein [Candidatus Thermoplasmatota archaeon]|nr:HEPN domain-containing protein [Candidatus Thermoplasmatota archaeon]